MATKLPYFPFYPGDWLSDEKLRLCSIAARGLWIDMLALMWKNDRRGFLQVAGGPPTHEQLGRMTGCSSEEAARLLAELVSVGVVSCTDAGVPWSRRMVRDEEIRAVRSRAGQKGGNATADLLKQNSNQTDSNRASKACSKDQASESESSSESETERKHPPPPLPLENKNEKLEVLPAALDTPEFRLAWATWQKHRREQKHPVTPTARKQQLKKLESMGVVRAIASLEHSTANGFQGVYEPTGNGHAQKPPEKTYEEKIRDLTGGKPIGT